MNCNTPSPFIFGNIIWMYTNFLQQNLNMFPLLNTIKSADTFAKLKTEYSHINIKVSYECD